MVTFSVPGAAIMAGLQFGLSNAVENGNDEFLVQVSGMRYEYSTTMRMRDGKATYADTIGGVFIGSAPVDPSALYSVTTNEFVFSVFQKILAQMQLQPANVVVADSTTEFQVVTAALAQMKSVTPRIEGRIRCSSATGSRTTSGPPTGYSLYAYPNPAREAATIRFTLPAASPVSIELYDNLGRSVAGAAPDFPSAGEHAIRIDTSALPAGLYHCVMTTPASRVSSAVSIVK
jgi:hypothetical protein